jgi:hypothetical protein
VEKLRWESRWLRRSRVSKKRASHFVHESCRKNTTAHNSVTNTVTINYFAAALSFLRQSTYTTTTVVVARHSSDTSPTSSSHSPRDSTPPRRPHRPPHAHGSNRPLLSATGPVAGGDSKGIQPRRRQPSTPSPAMATKRGAGAQLTKDGPAGDDHAEEPATRATAAQLANRV